MAKRGRIRKLLVANRSEIAIRVLRAANELGIRTVAIFSHEDRYALHRFKADEAYLVGRGRKPIEAYLDIAGILRIAREARVDAVHPGYGFLSENPDFAEACAADGLGFVGPPPAVMRCLGSKIEARALAERVGLGVMPASGPLPRDEAAMRRLARGIGFPLMAKASWGGGGRGIRVVEGEDELAAQVAAGRREAKAAFGDDEIFLEKLVRRARHIVCSSSATRRARSCTSSSATAPCSGATRRWWSGPPRPISTRPGAGPCARGRCASPGPPATATPAPPSS